MNSLNDFTISINNLRMSYDGENDVLKGITLDIEPGQVIGYIGPNGAGKSTTIKLMTGILRDYSGEIRIFGQDVSRNTEYKKMIGYVPESGDIYENLTPREYIIFLSRIYELDEEKTINKFENLMKIFGIESECDSRISGFSKGMKQKFIIISSLIHNPEIIFFDEPLNGLDANSVLIFKEILKNLKNSGKTIFYSSHVMDVVEKISDRIILINDGNVIANDSVNNLKQLVKAGSLENVFTHLTGENNSLENAKNFVDNILE